MHAPELKPGNAARGHWQHAADIRTPLALLYLHGFSASPGEAGALPEQMADALAANAYVHRWPGHGLNSPNAMQGLTPAVLQASALEALAQAQRMGQRVVIIGSSMGATLGLWLAVQHPDAVAAVVAWSPGIQPADPALLDQVCAAQAPLTDPRPRTPAARAFWSETIHPDGFRALRSLFRIVATDPPWPRVRCPVLLGYYRATDGREDATASVPAMLEMFAALGTAPAHKRAIAFDSGAHAIGSPHKTPLAGTVAQASVAFLQAQLGAAPHAGNA
ncbi:TPA: alpha/beta fold hydrolase [Xanthomonas vasicola pv. zeae]|uniref:Lysophospholipase n=2 Tax=Xanthomonas vasicola pv. vasculorum TaxID=325776 RepID=A0A836ZS49_XANVA|nr:alpha/beta fold hydrolase [Xanthomonas vasicola]KFA16151.1 lysophospholipase [Xanthomonas vasicola pv. musacearum NCPPB 4384]AVQ08348.1 lysophospholipase [Xanthomonas vasicola pv. vasculorum]AZM72546.1 lysophospholipase [Xanthomonas vasicola pv. vasculorum]AZR28249.1 alpha/beta fold hydrolase [Xanthomonas vasicola pv. arecae]AZR32501.1 alpha/beta fold hydrolase [Xanthomonas vasicola pv. musacearum NCPPB 4379]